jgi:hypothetical protein
MDFGDSQDKMISIHFYFGNAVSTTMSQGQKVGIFKAINFKSHLGFYKEHAKRIS